KSEVRSQKSEVRSQKSEVRSQKSEVRGQRSEVRSQRSEVRGQKSEVRSQSVRSQKSEVRGQKSEVQFCILHSDFLLYLQNLANVANSPGHPLAIKILEQRNGILAGHSDQFLEMRNVNLQRLLLIGRNLAAHFFQSAAMENQFVGDFDQHLVAQQESHDFLCPGFVDPQPTEDLLQSGHLHASGGKGVFDLLFRLRLFVLQDDAAPRQSHYIAEYLKLFFQQQLGHGRSEDLRGGVHQDPQFFFAHSGREAIPTVKIAKDIYQVRLQLLQRRRM